MLASLAKNALMLELGLAAVYSVIAIPAFTGKDLNNNSDEVLRIEADQISWLGK